jgi:hypothetical protein
LAAPAELNFSASTESDCNFSTLDDHGYLTAAFGIFEHTAKAVVVLFDVDVFEGDFAAGVIRTGSRRVRSKILAKDKDGFGTHVILLEDKG